MTFDMIHDMIHDMILDFFKMTVSKNAGDAAATARVTREGHEGLRNLGAIIATFMLTSIR
jgi:hypothetical protein